MWNKSALFWARRETKCFTSAKSEHIFNRHFVRKMGVSAQKCEIICSRETVIVSRGNKLTKMSYNVARNVYQLIHKPQMCTGNGLTAWVEVSVHLCSETRCKIAKIVSWPLPSYPWILPSLKAPLFNSVMLFVKEQDAGSELHFNLLPQGILLWGTRNTPQCSLALGAVQHKIYLYVCLFQH